jgi:serine/threonine protein kinase
LNNIFYKMADEHAASSSSHIFTRPEYFPSDVDKDQLIFPGINETFKFKKKDFIYKDTIGSSIHTVYCYVFTPLSRDIAIKKIPMPYNPSPYRSCKQEEGKKWKKLVQEIRNFRILSTYPHIVDFYGLCLHEGEAWLCMERMDFSLREVYQKVHEAFETMLATSAAFPENIMGVIAIRIIDALSFCQSKGIMHRDVKPDNILLNGEGKVKLCDFGVSKQMQGI